MDWEQVQNLLQTQIAYWRAVGKQEWAEALEQCLAKAEEAGTGRVAIPACLVHVVSSVRRRLPSQALELFRGLCDGHVIAKGL